MRDRQRGVFDLVLLAVVGVVFAGVVAAAYFAISAIEKKGYDKGVAEQAKVTARVEGERDQARREGAQEKALRLAAEANVGQLVTALEGANARVEELGKATTAAQERARAAIAKATADATRYRAEVARLKTIVEGPPLTSATAAEAEAIALKADAILRQLAVARTGG